MANKQSALLSNRIDVKNFTISLFASELQKPVFLTAFCSIEGDLAQSHGSDTQDDPKRVIDPIFVATMQKRNETIAEWEQEVGEKAKLINDGQFFMLRNVVITPYSNPHTPIKMNEMILFSDQIVGLSAK